MAQKDDIPESLMKRLDKLERFDPGMWNDQVVMDRDRDGPYVRFEQVKTVVGQWVADQRGR